MRYRRARVAVARLPRISNRKSLIIRLMKTRARSVFRLPPAVAAISWGGFLMAGLCLLPSARAQTPQLVDHNLNVRAVVTGLSTPTSIAFLGANDLLVLEKATGRVKRVVDGVVQATVLDLAVNSASERGLLGIALHPSFPATPWVYLYWTQSSTGADSTVLGETELLGNRVDRFIWNGSTLTLENNIIRL